ncbi:hypothetical protein L1887_55623 [Cichorium endivia]|nr:hypothetical protein L1887_55623 [Cichorium endivia]
MTACSRRNGGAKGSDAVRRAAGGGRIELADARRAAFAEARHHACLSTLLPAAPLSSRWPLCLFFIAAAFRPLNRAGDLAGCRARQKSHAKRPPDSSAFHIVFIPPSVDLNPAVAPSS